MIFATDLDRTLIFSSKFLNKCKDSKIICVEKNKTSEVSYMTQKSFHLLEELKDMPKLFVVPITTRSVEQFKRITNLENSDYAIVSNGGNILYKGKKLVIWEEYINSILKKYTMEFKSIPDLLKPFDFCLSTEVRLVDDIFYYMKVKENPEDIDKILAYLEENLDKNIWNFTLQGLKLYIIPKGITKEIALSFLANYLNELHIITAGDGKLDKAFLELGEICLIPRNSEVLDHIDSDFNYITVPSGLEGTEILLGIVKTNVLSD